MLFFLTLLSSELTAGGVDIGAESSSYGSVHPAAVQYLGKAVGALAVDSPEITLRNGIERNEIYMDGTFHILFKYGGKLLGFAL